MKPGFLSRHPAAVCVSLRAAAIVFLLLGSLLSAFGAALTRLPNTSLKLPQDPSRIGFVTREAFPGLVFTNPVAIVSAPGETNRLFVVERAGVVLVLTNLAQPSRTVFLNLTDKVNSDYSRGGSEGLTSLAFHPRFAENGYFFVTYATFSRLGRQNHLARYRVAPANPNAAETGSEARLLSQRDEGYGHNWNDLHFGPDGYLYLAMGDEGDAQDQFHNSQRIDRDFFSGIVRLDVDQRAGNPAPNPHPSVIGHYSVPIDNPYVGATQFNNAAVDPAAVRTEFYAVGLRNPWRMSFDPLNGELFAGDVGQHAFEEINVIVKGGNYGWAYFEGTKNGFKGAPPAGVEFIPPVVQYAPGFATNQGTCIIGGVVARNGRIPYLEGRYLFADYASGHIWALRRNVDSSAAMEWLVTDAGIVSFGRDPRNHDILLADHEEGVIKRLDFQSISDGGALPPTLADTGAFVNLETLAPNDGIVPYEINVPFWSDNAEKRRWFSIPDANSKMIFDSTGPWGFPAGAVWIKHFDLELTNGIPASRRRIETRFIVRNSTGVYGVTYRWNEAQNNATLVPEQGMDETFVIRDGSESREQVWRYPSRNECLTCHTASAGHILGFNAAQLNLSKDFGGERANQLLAWHEAGYFSNSVPAAETLPALVPATNEAVSLEYRVRSYLAANCSQCHQPDGKGAGTFDTRIATRTEDAGLVDGSLTSGDPENRVIRPGSLSQSAILARISTLGEGRMPPLASRVIDTNAVELLSRWITNDAPSFRSFAAWQTEHFGSTNEANGAWEADADGDGAANGLEFLTRSNPEDASDRWRASVTNANGTARVQLTHPANRKISVEAASSLEAPQWERVALPADVIQYPSASRELLLEHPVEGSSARYYRIQISPP